MYLQDALLFCFSWYLHLILINAIRIDLYKVLQGLLYYQSTTISKPFLKPTLSNILSIVLLVTFVRDISLPSKQLNPALSRQTIHHCTKVHLLFHTPFIPSHPDHHHPQCQLTDPLIPEVGLHLPTPIFPPVLTHSSRSSLHPQLQLQVQRQTPHTQLPLLHSSQHRRITFPLLKRLHQQQLLSLILIPVEPQAEIEPKASHSHQ